MAKKKLSGVELALKKVAKAVMQYVDNNTSAIDTSAKITVNLEEYINGSKTAGNPLNGIVVSLQDITNNTAPVEKTWAGEPLVFDKLTTLVDYRISVQSLAEHKVDYQYQDIINIGLNADATKTFKFEAVRYTATMTSDQDVSGGAQDSNIDRSASGVYLVAQYTYGGNTVTSGQLHYGETLLMPADVDTSTITIASSSDVSGYKKTSSVDTVNKTINVGYETSFISGYIILDQTSSDPTQKVIDENGKTYSQGYTTPEVISTIRQMSHCYVQQLYSNGTISIKQLDDTDGTKYADGTSCASDITTKNVFMRLPYFYTKVSTYATDKIKIEFWIDTLQNIYPSESGWKQWGGNDLIGKYEGSCSDISDNTTGTLCSISGAEPTSEVSQLNFKAKARNNGAGFTCVKWKHNNIMAILFYAYYGHTNCQLLIGSGGSSNDKNTGLKNANGMTDTTSSTGNTDNIVFWGLENWWGNKSELVDNVIANVPNFTITEEDNSIRTITTTGSSTNRNIYPTKFILGDYLDILAVPGTTGGTATTGYCDSEYLKTGSNHIVARSGPNNYDSDGVACLNTSSEPSTADNQNFGSRLAFTGTVEIID